jgi:quercetin dioxygenase-like cupin family protein
MVTHAPRKTDPASAPGEVRVLAFPAFPEPTPHVILWDGPGRPREEALRDRLIEAGYQAVKWTSEPATGYPPHVHIYPELLWLVSGSLTVILPATERLIELAPGDRIEVPQGIAHGTMAGADGATYLLATK